jgi:type VI protein secretion system component VasF
MGQAEQAIKRRVMPVVRVIATIGLALLFLYLGYKWIALTRERDALKEQIELLQKGGN